MEDECEHVWGEFYHTHLGHSTLGSHAEHQDCTACGAIKNRVFGTKMITIYPPDVAAYAKPHWTILNKPHECSAGWRGVVVEEGVFP